MSMPRSHEVRPVAIYLLVLRSRSPLTPHRTSGLHLPVSLESALLAVHAPAESLVHAPDVPVERPDLLDGALIAVDLDPLDERANNFLARLADAHS